MGPRQGYSYGEGGLGQSSEPRWSGESMLGFESDRVCGLGVGVGGRSGGQAPND